MVKKIEKRNSIKKDTNLKQTKKITNSKQTSRTLRNKEKKNYNIDKIIDQDKSQTNINFVSPMLASNYDGSQDIKGWFMSEKLDGIRCIWNGICLKSRNGNLFYPPDYFIEKFPKDLCLDGELFMSRNNFQDTVSIVKRQDKNDGWKNIKFLVFDVPNIKGNFKNRLQILEKRLKDCTSSYIEIHKHEICKDHDHLIIRMKEITSIKGEGIILRDPNSIYENRRTKTMLKVKEFHDAEAEVTAIHRGTGRISNLMGAIECKNKDGIIFKIGTGFTDAQRANPPKIGSIVTYRYFELTKDNIPRFPSFMRTYNEI